MLVVAQEQGLGAAQPGLRLSTAAAPRALLFPHRLAEQDWVMGKAEDFSKARKI